MQDIISSQPVPESQKDIMQGIQVHGPGLGRELLLYGMLLCRMLQQLSVVLEIKNLIFPALVDLQDMMGPDHVLDRVDFIFPEDFVIEFIELQGHSQDGNQEIDPWFLK
jgi:hypothetical protein